LILQIMGFPQSPPFFFAFVSPLAAYVSGSFGLRPIFHAVPPLSLCLVATPLITSETCPLSLDCFVPPAPRRPFFLGVPTIISFSLTESPLSGRIDRSRLRFNPLYGAPPPSFLCLFRSWAERAPSVIDGFPPNLFPTCLFPPSNCWTLSFPFNSECSLCSFLRTLFWQRRTFCP